MFSLLVAVVCGLAGGALSVPVPAPSSSTLPDYFVIESIPQIGSAPSQQNGVAAPETEVQLRRQSAQARINDVMQNVLSMLNLPCVPRGPPDTASVNIDPKFIPMLQKLMQDQTDSDSEDVLRRAQSFYPTCELPEDVGYMSLLHRDSMNMYFNLSSFFLSQPENVTIDMAELRLYRARDRVQQSGFDFGWRQNDMDSDRVRVSVYARDANLPGDERLVDSFLTPRYSQEAVTLNVSDAVWSTEDLNLLLRVTVEDVFGGSLSADAFFVQMDCSVVNESPLPRPLMHFSNKHNIPMKPHNLYPVLDLGTAEMAGSRPQVGFVPNMKLCPEPQPLLDSQVRLHNPHNGFADSLRMTSRPKHRRHNRRPHRRGHSGRRAQRHWGQH